MTQNLNILKESASQTAGPYVHIGLTPNFLGIEGVYPHDLGREMLNEKTKGTRIQIDIRIIDGTGTPLKDALIEIWQADSDGLYNSVAENRGKADENFTGWGRFPTDLKTGDITINTIKPGPVPHPTGAMQCPHINFWIVARGINLGLNTRMYFPDEDNHADPLLKRLEHQNRVPTVIGQEAGNARYKFDIYLQGPNETLFFDI